MTCALYRHFDKSGALLYVGITTAPAARLRQHLKASDWRDQINDVSTIWFDRRSDAEQAERTAIQNERPIHNRVHKVDNHAKRIPAHLGDSFFLDHLGMTKSCLRFAKVQGTFGSKWYRMIVENADGLDIPLEAFRFKKISDGDQ